MNTDKNGTPISVGDTVQLDAGTITSIQTGLDGFTRITLQIPPGESNTPPIEVNRAQVVKQ